MNNRNENWSLIVSEGEFYIYLERDGKTYWLPVSKEQLAEISKATNKELEIIPF